MHIGAFDVADRVINADHGSTFDKVFPALWEAGRCSGFLGTNCAGPNDRRSRQANQTRAGNTARSQ